MDTNEPKYNKSELRAKANVRCVPVPITWLKLLVAKGSNTTFNSIELADLKGFVSSAKGFYENY